MNKPKERLDNRISVEDFKELLKPYYKDKKAILKIIKTADTKSTAETTNIKLVKVKELLKGKEYPEELRLKLDINFDDIDAIVDFSGVNLAHSDFSECTLNENVILPSNEKFIFDLKIDISTLSNAEKDKFNRLKSGKPDQRALFFKTTETQTGSSTSSSLLNQKKDSIEEGKKIQETKELSKSKLPSAEKNKAKQSKSGSLNQSTIDSTIKKKQTMSGSSSSSSLFNSTIEKEQTKEIQKKPEKSETKKSKKKGNTLLQKTIAFTAKGKETTPGSRPPSSLFNSTKRPLEKDPEKQIQKEPDESEFKKPKMS